MNVKPPKATTDPKKLARLRAVELMRMRHHAMPADPKDKSVSPNERIHVKIRVNTSSPSADKLFWLRKVRMIASKMPTSEYPHLLEHRYRSGTGFDC